MLYNFFENRALYEIMWKNTVEPDKPQMTTWRMLTACSILDYKHTLRICNIYCFGTTTMIKERVPLLKLCVYVCCLSCLICTICLSMTAQFVETCSHIVWYNIIQWVVSLSSITVLWLVHTQWSVYVKKQNRKNYFFSALWRRFEKLPLGVLHSWQ